MLTDRQQRHQEPGFQARSRLFSYAGAILFFIILMRFYHIQIIQGRFFHKMSESNRLALVRVKAPRGMILDREGRVLVSNRPSFNVSLVMEDVQDVPDTVEMLTGELHLEHASVENKLMRVSRYRQFEPVSIKDDISRLNLAFLETLKTEYPGVLINVEPRRHYPEGNLAAHILGYVGEVSKTELDAMRYRGYRMGDFTGKYGLEKKFDEYLKGIDGGLQVEVDSLGRRLRVVSSRDFLPGDNLVMTLDLEIQRVAERALGKARGAVVVINPMNGEILAAASHPDYNPNLFAGGILPENWKVLSKDYRHPLQNRVIQSHYPPGSVFKLVTATAGLAEGVIDRNSTFICRGQYWFGGRFYRCWKKEGHGKLSIHRAIVESCDIFFYQLGEMLGIDTIARYGRKLGLGRRTGLGLPGEWTGLIPDSGWKKRVRGEIWYPGETLSASIGQGYNLLTPIQGAVLISAIANGGEIYRPMLVRSVVSPEGKVMEEFYPEKISQADIKPWVLKEVRKGMKGAVNEPHGTGWRARLEHIEVAGKTGTAQVIRMGDDEEEKELEEIPEKFRDHAWFGCYAPADAPQVVILVLIEHGGHGGSASAPVATEILKELVRNNYFGSADGET